MYTYSRIYIFIYTKIVFCRTGSPPRVNTPSACAQPVTSHDDDRFARHHHRRRRRRHRTIILLLFGFFFFFIVFRTPFSSLYHHRHRPCGYLGERRNRRDLGSGTARRYLSLFLSPCSSISPFHTRTSSGP